MSFVHLVCRTHYSFLDGVMSPEEMIEKASSLGQSHIAITDNANLCGMLNAKKAAEKHGIGLVYGVQIWVGKPEKKKEPEQLGLFGRPEEGPSELWPDYKLILLVQSEEGFRNASKLISIAHKQRRYAPLIKAEQIRGNEAGIIAIASMEYAPEKEDVRELKSIFKKNLFIEIYDHGEPNDEEKIEHALAIHRSCRVDLVASNNCAYAEPEQSPLLSIMRSIASGHSSTSSNAPIRHETDQAYVKSIDAIPMSIRRFEDAVHNTVKIASSCDYTPKTGLTLLPNTLPPTREREEGWRWLLDTFPPPKSYAGKATHEPEKTKRLPIVDAYFCWYCRTGLDVRIETEESLQFATKEEYRQRLDNEIDIILDMGFSAYHLIVTEFINWAKDNGIPVGPGRGSAAGAVVCWSMRITDVNPMQFDLMFERYLNPERISMPDIDVDFAQNGRERVIEHVRTKYGDDCVCQILTIGAMKAKAALKDAARSIGVGFNEANHWSSYIEDGPKAKLESAIEDSEQIQSLMTVDPKFKRAMSIARNIEGKPRQTGVHAAGVIITSQPIMQIIPCHAYKDKSGWKTTTGLEMGPSENMGLVKFDFLGLKTLDIIELALDSIEERTGHRPTISKTDFTDEAVYELLAKGDSLGLFQVESKGMRALLLDMVPDQMEDIVAISALYRPGPLGSGMVTQYVECKHGRQEPNYPHPLLEKVLKPTHGVFVFQEQVMAAAQVLAGFTLGQADMLRRAMGKKKQAEMDKQRAKFIDGCKKTNGIDEEESEKIFNLIDHFAGYGFNRSHSASYGMITYTTAWLKAHYRADLMAAAMTLEAADRAKLSSYILDCARADIHVVSPDINRSVSSFSVEKHPDNPAKHQIRYGMKAIKGVAGESLSTILEERTRNGAYRTYEDFIRRVRPNKKTLVALICSGALDEIISTNRFETWWNVVQKARKHQDESLFEQEDRFIGMDESEQKETFEEKPPEWTLEKRLAKEHEVLGCWLSGHPLDRFIDIERRISNQQTSEIIDLKRGESATLSGVIIDVHRSKSRRGDDMAFFTISDRNGSCRVICPDTSYSANKRSIKKGRCVIIKGTKDRDGHEGTLRIHSVQPMEEKRRTITDLLQIELKAQDLNDKTLGQIKALLEERRVSKREQKFRMYPKIKYIVHISEAVTAEIWTDDYRYDVDQTIYDKIESLTGRANALSSPM